MNATTRAVSTAICLIAAAVTLVTVAVRSMIAAEKSFVASSDVTAMEVATRAGKKIIDLSDKVLANTPVTIEECSEWSAALRLVRMNLNDPNLDRRTTTVRIRNLTGPRDWLDICTRTASVGNTESYKVGWLTASESLLKIGRAKARYAHFLSLIEQSKGVKNMSGQQVHDALCDVVSVLDFLKEVDRSKRDMSFKSISGTCWVLKGDFMLILDKSLPSGTDLMISLARLNEVYSLRSSEASQSASR